MAILEIKTFPDPVLLKKAEPVSIFDEELKELASDMAQTMYDAPGVGLAAPQIGKSIQLITVDIQAGDGGGELITLVNPRIVESVGEQVGEEGCLSVPEIREEIKRAYEITVEARNLDGENISIKADEFLSVVLQHEMDHLVGRLFIDKLSRLKRGLIVKKLKKAAAQDD